MIGRELRYTDARRFGRIAYLTKASLAGELTGFGADPLEVSKEEFADRICGRRARIKRCCWTRAFSAALAIIYADEEPVGKRRFHSSAAGSQSEQKTSAHIAPRAAKHSAGKRLCCAGPRFPIFLTAEGEPGEYQRHHRAYGREAKDVIGLRRRSGARL